MVTFDRIMDPDTLIDLGLTDAQSDSLCEEALSDRLFEMDQPQLLQTAWPTTGSGVLFVKAGFSRRRFEWAPWSPSARWTDDHKRLNAYVENLWRMVSNSPEYRAMPRPRGMYID